MKKITTTAGTAFLIWLIFSPIIGLWLFSKIYPESASGIGPSPIIYIVIIYLVLGIAAYYLVKSTGGVFLKEEKSPSEWGITFSYTILTSMIHNAIMGLIFLLLRDTSLVAVSFIVSPFIFWMIVRIRAHSVSPVPESVVKKSIYFFVIVNLVFALLFKFLMNQKYVSITDLILVLNIIIFYFATKRCLITIDRVNQALEKGGRV